MRKAKVKDTDCIINVMPKDTGGYIGSDGVTYKESQLDFLPEESPEPATIEGWVARNANPHCLNLFKRKPYRLSDIWSAFDSNVIALDPTFFPSVTWESEPLKV